jgi:EAL domain-containing protein (putative c-di-GMP-specific phosphodiesterase class I)
MAVNISGRQLEKREVLGAVANALINTQVPADHLELEITESVVMENAEDMISVFHELKKMNVHLAIDDFGTGYSSLAYLKRFPVDTIKVDRSFIQDIPGDSEDVAIVTGVIAMAKGLGLKVVAEGVENVSQQEFLKEKGCDYIQGYYLSEPLPPDEFERRFLQPHRRRSGDNVTLFKRS